jgi:hypothetical protein
VEPDPFGVSNFTVVAQPGGVSSGSFGVEGSSGARYVGVFGTAGSTVTSVTITSSVGFAVGDLGWARGGRCDPDGDGDLDTKDAIALLLHLLLGKPLGGPGDCNGVGNVTFGDVLAILRRS